MKTNFHNKNFAFSLAFIMRFKATRKWSIAKRTHYKSEETGERRRVLSPSVPSLFSFYPAPRLHYSTHCNLLRASPLIVWDRLTCSYRYVNLAKRLERLKVISLGFRSTHQLPLEGTLSNKRLPTPPQAFRGQTIIIASCIKLRAGSNYLRQCLRSQSKHAKNIIQCFGIC